jgi:ribosomal protein S18 acetylase RimI-like enzyme
VRLAALEEAPYAFGSTYEREAAASDDRWKQVVRDRARFVAEAAERVVGTVSGDSTMKGTAAITAMWVDPRHRGQGVGDELVRTALEWARGQGYSHIVLCVREGNSHADRLYRRHGFARTGVLCAEGPEAEYEMGRKL